MEEMKQTNKQKTKHNETQYCFNYLFASSLNTTSAFLIFKSIQMKKKQKKNESINCVHYDLYMLWKYLIENINIWLIPKPVKWNTAIKHWIFV